jgi:hypothetical protein
MLANELFDTVVFLCAWFIAAGALMAMAYFFCNYVLGMNLDWS